MGLYFFLNLSGLFEQFMEKRKKEKNWLYSFCARVLTNCYYILEFVRVCLKLPNLKWQAVLVQLFCLYPFLKKIDGI